MGTNYYLHHPDKPPCACCGREYPNEPLHIGKSSAGWCFALHAVPERGINDLEDWRRVWSEGGEIRDEYGQPVTPEDMETIITNRAWAPKYHSAYYLSQNSAEVGPNGLLRHRVDSHHCTAHGAGTWDILQGEFS